ncbi:MAG: restriction endonuclease [Parachlamydia sp.]|nr:restriction endonuclease [Parachlamydia sp.]
MTVSAKNIFHYIRNSFETPKGDLETLVSDAITSLSDRELSPCELDEFVERFVGPVKAEIMSYLSKCSSEGKSPDLEFGTHPSTLINRRARTQKATKDFLCWLSEINPFKFETLCKKVLELEGCYNVEVTPPSGDGGIDFYGSKNVIMYDSSLSLFKNVEVLVLGQAKRYSNPIGVEEIRSFVGSQEVIKIAGLANCPTYLSNLLHGQSYRPLAPILLVFITSNEPKGNTKDFARWLGIRFISGTELADIFYSHKFGFRMHESGVQFEPADFEAL